MKTRLDVKEILSNAWKAVISQFWILVGLLVGYGILIFTIFVFSVEFESEDMLVKIIIGSGLALMAGSLFLLGYLKNIFQTLDGVEPQFSSYITQARKVFTILISYVICLVIVLVGSVFLILPGIYLGIRFQYVFALIVEEDTGILESFKRSWKITEKHIKPLIILFIVMKLVAISGVILFGVGLFVTIPLAYCMYALGYRKLNTLKSVD